MIFTLPQWINTLIKMNNKQSIFFLSLVLYVTVSLAAVITMHPGLMFLALPMSAFLCGVTAEQADSVKNYNVLTNN